MNPQALHSIVQVVALVALTLGVFLLFGIPWALTVGGLGLFVGSVALEASMPRTVVHTSDEVSG